MLLKLTLAILIIVLLTKIPNNCKESFNNSRLYLAGPTRCFSCEKDIIARTGSTDFAFMGKPTKCFHCEREMVQNGTPNLANLTAPTKCFSCEGELL